MQRFTSSCGLLMFLLVLAGFAFGGKGSVAANLVAAAFAAVMVVWLVVATVVFLVRTVLSLGRSIARDINHGVVSIGRQDRQDVHYRYEPPIPLPSYDPLERLCRESGWLLVSRENDRYTVRSGDHTRQHHVQIRYNERYPNAVFQSAFPVRFSLEREAQGLYARLMMRNRDLHWSSWTMTIGGSTEAILYVAASLPPQSLTAHLFDQVCREMVGEIEAFHAELHSKFCYGLGHVVNSPPAYPVQEAPRGGVPQRHGDNGSGIRYLQ